jgi:hypothetical protein
MAAHYDPAIFLAPNLALWLFVWCPFALKQPPTSWIQENALPRIDKSWIVVDSIEPSSADRCVDLFARPDGSYGFEEFRRDPEDAGLWTPIGYFSGTHYFSREAAVSAAMAAIPWLKEAAARRSGTT